MLYNAKEGSIAINNTYMDYITFGSGKKVLIMLPGLGDGLKTVKGMALTLSVMYRAYARYYKVYIFSRINDIPTGYSTRDMAKNQADAMKYLDINKADIIGVSQGGMIAQYLAIDYPEKVDKLVLTVSVSRQNETLENAVKGWIEIAKRNDYKNLMIDTAEKSYSEARLKKYRLLYPVLTKAGKPKNFERFISQAEACLKHNTYDELFRIKAPALIIGGDNDKIVGENASEEMAEKIKNSQLIIYKGLGHATYEEAPDYDEKVLQFLTQ